MRLCKQVLSGFNTTVFAYGQTGTGKTYTMLGGDYTGKHYKVRRCRLTLIPKP